MAYNKDITRIIAKYYYEEGLNQTQIAKLLDISRPIVSKKLAEARENGIVKIFICNDEEGVTDMEDRIRATFNLRALKLVEVPEADPELALEMTARMGAEYLSTFIEANDRIGMDWGWTINEMTTFFKYNNVGVDTVVQCTGTMDDVKSKRSPDGIIKAFANKLQAKHAYSLSVPVMVGNEIIAKTLMFDKRLEQTMSIVNSCNKFIVNVALPGKDSCLYRLGYMNDEDVARMEANGAVGSLCCRFFKEDGTVCDEELDSRTISASFETIRNAECIMACLSGTSKARATYYALKAGFIDVAVIDTNLAKKIIEIMDSEEA